MRIRFYNAVSITCCRISLKPRSTRIKRSYERHPLRIIARLALIHCLRLIRFAGNSCKQLLSLRRERLSRKMSIEVRVLLKALRVRLRIIIKKLRILLTITKMMKTHNLLRSSRLTVDILIIVNAIIGQGMCISARSA